MNSGKQRPCTHSCVYRARALTLLEMVAVLFVLGVVFLLVISVVLPGLFRQRGDCSYRLVCASNIKGIGTSSKIYANENRENWPMPAFDEALVGQIDYTVKVGGGEGSVRSPNRLQPSLSGPGGARQLSVTRAMWMLVRSGDITVKQFICPNGGDVEDSTTGTGAYLDAYYDFTDYKNVSYGFQVPFGPPGTRAREDVDNRMIFAADKGPYIDPSVAAPPPGLKPIIAPPGTYSIPKPNPWQPFNSRNHQGEGQNVLYADGHAEFKRVPTVGVDGDNIYTIALDNVNESSWVAGESPWQRSLPPFTPFGVSSTLSSTDSVIFP